MEMLVPLHQALDETYPKVWRTIAECIFIGLDEMDTQRRVQQTLQITDVLRAELGGLQPYLPKGGDYDNAVQYRDLYNQFNGRNIADLAAASGVCLRVLYKHFSVLKREDFKRRQAGFEF
ncbi:MAG: hypothetical protein LWW81_11525 [Rhodocyclales bacterium]|nr:hypothetical protein [Rhodocyclales bacterium]MCE1186187.1 hypothetical protein [Rhodocyclales bacterium]